MMKIQCWFFHRWGVYGIYEYDSDVENTWLGRMVSGDLLSYIPALHIRTCERCGKEERHDFRDRQIKTRPPI